MLMIFFYISLFFCGLILGSFLNVVIHRFPIILENQWHQECLQQLNITPRDYHKLINKTLQPQYYDANYSLAWPSSHCPHCHQKLQVWHNIPLLSFFILGGKCRYCRQSISWRYPIVEFATACLSVFIGWHYGLQWICLGGLLFTWLCIAMLCIDISKKLLPDQLTLTLLWLGLLFNAWDIYTTPTAAIIGAAAGYTILWLIFKTHFFLTKREGMGYGDFKLLAAIGAWVGWQLLPLTILIASLTGVIGGLILLTIKGKSWQTHLAFGPYLITAGWIVLLFGPNLLNLLNAVTS